MNSAHHPNNGNTPRVESGQTYQREPDFDLRDLDFIAGERDVGDFNRALRHSNRVRILRVAFPLIGVFILSLVIGAYFWSQSFLPQVTIAATEIRNDKMVMKNPALNGVDEKNRPYNLKASEAITNPKQPKQVELMQIDATVPMDEGVFAKILAGNGFYDADAKTLKLGGEVDVKTDNGMTLRLQDADVDMGLGTLVTQNPVSITTEQAIISSEKMSVANNGEVVVFENRVRMTIYPDKIEQTKSNAPKQQ